MADLNLTPEQRRTLRDVMLQAFPRRIDLAEMVYYGLQENLVAITEGNSLRELVLSLIQWADARDRLADLIQAACTANPTNQRLNAFATEVAILSPPAVQSLPTTSAVKSTSRHVNKEGILTREQRLRLTDLLLCLSLLDTREGRDLLLMDLPIALTRRIEHSDMAPVELANIVNVTSQWKSSDGTSALLILLNTASELAGDSIVGHELKRLSQELTT